MNSNWLLLMLARPATLPLPKLLGNTEDATGPRVPLEVALPFVLLIVCMGVVLCINFQTLHTADLPREESFCYEFVLDM